MTPRLQRLRAEVASDRAAFLSRLEELASLQLSVTTPDAGDVARVAVALRHAYSAIETLLLRLAREFEGEPLSGADWHQSLLETMGLEIDGVRPRIVSPQTMSVLRVMLGFRHFFRHAYAVALDPAQLEVIREKVVSARDALLSDIDGVDTLLEALSRIQRA